MDIIAPLLALVAYALRKERRLGEHVFILAYILVQLVFNVYAKILWQLQIPNTYVYQMNSFASLFAISLYFGRQFTRFRVKNIPVIYPIAVTSLIALAAIILTETSAIFNSRSYSFAAFIITAYTIGYYYVKLANPELAQITGTRTFWFVTGLFFYYSGCFIIFCTYRLFIQAGKGNFGVLWSIHNVIIFIMCIIFSIGFRCKSYQKI